MFTRRSELFPTIQIAIIIAPIFILRFIRIQAKTKGVLLTLLGFILSMNIALWGLFEGNDAGIMLTFNIIRSTLLAILYFLPYMVDRLIYPKFKNKGVWSTLTFPIVMTGIFFLSSIEGPFDGATAKTIYAYGPLYFKQLISITGLWGFIFIYSWLAAIINYAWEHKFSWLKTKKYAICFASVIAAISLFGLIKTSYLMSPDSDEVKIAAIVLLPEDGEVVSMEEMNENKISSPFEETISKIESLTKKAAEEKAQIVALQEYAINIQEYDENKLQLEYQRIARENNIYFSASYVYYSEKEKEKGRNKNLLIDNEGKILIEYDKRFLLGFGPFGETAVFEKGTEVIQSIDTPYGRIGIAICRDMNFPAYIKQASEQDVDIMISPAYDWPKSTGPSNSLRSIEYGFSFIRPTYNGVTFAEDFNGKILEEMDSEKTNTGIMYAKVPTKGVNTLYGICGDIFGWMCLTMLIILNIPFIRNKLLIC